MTYEMLHASTSLFLKRLLLLLIVEKLNLKKTT